MSEVKEGYSKISRLSAVGVTGSVVGDRDWDDVLPEYSETDDDRILLLLNARC